MWDFLLMGPLPTEQGDYGLVNPPHTLPAEISCDNDISKDAFQLTPKEMLQISNQIQQGDTMDPAKDIISALSWNDSSLRYFCQLAPKEGMPEQPLPA
uniref:Uncharacterized protein n=1 Tax=Romanomermis culicivorax TaxID=13658 RepID=A0A915I2I3_ROMCU